MARRQKKAVILGSALTYEQFAAILAKRRKHLGYSQLALDDRAGLQSGYVGKMEIGSKRGGRNAGWSLSLPLWLQSLGVEIVLVAREDKR